MVMPSISSSSRMPRSARHSCATITSTPLPISPATCSLIRGACRCTLVPNIMGGTPCAITA
jgi:hypothetical protein